MLSIPLRPIVPALLVLGLTLPIRGGCDASSGTPSASGSGSAASDADPGRSAFEITQLPETGILGADPAALARDLFGAREPMEGLYREGVETLAASADGQVVLFIQMDLPDDSLRGMRHRLEFLSQDGLWRLAWAGRQVLCRTGRGHEDWGTAHCR